MNVLVDNPPETVSRRTACEPGLGEDRALPAYERGKEKLALAKEKLVVAEKGFETYVRAHPVRSVLVATGVGVLFGVLLGRRR